MTDSRDPIPGTPGVPAGASVAELARVPGAKKPAHISENEWLKHRVAAGQVVVVRSHFKSIYLVPMTILSLICGIWMTFATGGAQTDASAAYKVGLVWTSAFVFYMNMFIFEWSRTWTYILLSTIAVLVFLGFAVNGPDFPVWHKLGQMISGTKFGQTAASYFFFAIYFALCAAVSWVRSRFNYVVVEHNELQLYRNAFFGDRERVSMLNPRIEVRIPDMLEYFHPFYRAGQIIIHAPDRTIVLENVLKIRVIERMLDRLTGTLNVQVERRDQVDPG